MIVARKVKAGLLIAVTSLAISYTRYGLETGWASWKSLEQFLVFWFVHWGALMLMVLASVAAIVHFREYFLGRSDPEPSVEDLVFYVLMTALVSTIFVFIVAHWIPTSEDYYSDGTTL